ncbi:MAG: GDSL-type esterase/lipase family protein [Acetobacter aceti]
MATTWTQTSDTPITAAIAAVGAGQALVDGWIDVTGGVWSAATIWSDTTAGHYYLTSIAESTPWSGGALYRPQSEDGLSQRLKATYRVDYNQTLWFMLRANRSTTSAGFNGYLVAIDGISAGKPYIHVFPMIAGSTSATIGSATTTPVAIPLNGSSVNGQMVNIDIQLTQVTTTTSRMVVSVTDSSGNAIGSYDSGTTDANINAAALQNVAGAVGLCAYAQAGKGGASGVQAISVYSGAAAATSATTYTVSPATSSIVAGGSTVVTFKLDAAAAADVTITPGDDSAGGAWSAATLKIAAGSLSGQLTYTAPSAAASVTLTGTNDSSLTNGSANLTVTAGATAPGAPGVVLTPGNGQLTVAVTAPSSNGGSAITGYPIYVGTSAGGEAATPVTTLTAAGSYTITNLTNGTPVYVKVGATNAVGTTKAAEQMATPVAPSPTGTLVTVDSPAFVFSPGNWKGDSGRTGSGWRRTWNVGAYLRFGVKTGASPSVVLHLGPSASAGTVLTFTNGASMTWSKAAGDVTIPGLAANASNVIAMRFDLTPQSARWANGANNLLISGATIDGGSVISALSVLPKGWVLIVGDSITEGIMANAGKDDFSYGYTSQLMDALAVAGYELCVSACGYSGYLVTGDTTKDVPPYYQVTGSSGGQGGAFNASGSRFGLIDSDTSLLDSAGHLSGWGQTGQEPAAVIVNYGTNEALSTNGGPWSTSDFTAAMVQCMAAHRAKAPNAWLMPMMPVGFYYSGEYDPKWLSAFNQAVSLYRSTYPSDTKVAVIDIGSDLSNRIQANSSYINTGDVHPNALGHALIGATVSAQVLKILTGSTAVARSPNYGPASGG